MSWTKTTVITPEGPRDAVAPEVISASRATDIPAFYGDWLMRRLDAGYVRWLNRFNGRSQYVSFERMRAIVFWSKDPQPFLQHLDTFDRLGVAYYFQCTLNDYESDYSGAIEPNVPPLDLRIRTFEELSRRIGRHRVIWRFDPFLLTREIDVECLLMKVKRIGNSIHPFAERFVFSFADIDGYPRVRDNLLTAGIRWTDFTADKMRELAEGIADLNRQWGLRLATCAEKMDLMDLGIEHNRCIDDELLLRISNDDPELLRLFGVRDNIKSERVTKGESKELAYNRARLKDKGQRPQCGCVVSKDIGQYDTCAHLCAYCYANTSQEAVKRNRKNLTIESEAILP